MTISVVSQRLISPVIPYTVVDPADGAVDVDSGSWLEVILQTDAPPFAFAFSNMRAQVGPWPLTLGVPDAAYETDLSGSVVVGGVPIIVDPDDSSRAIVRLRKSGGGWEDYVDMGLTYTGTPGAVSLAHQDLLVYDADFDTDAGDLPWARFSTGARAVAPPLTPEITDHCAIALRRLIAQYREQADFEALICKYADVVQAQEQLLTDIRVRRGIANGDGIRLDWIGELYQLPRNGLGDTQYKRLLNARARAVQSRGLPEDMIAILAIAINGGEQHLFQHYAATFLQVITGNTTATMGRLIAKVLDVARPRGVHRVLWHQDLSPGPLFGWDETPDAVGWDGTGPSDGHWAEAH